MIVHALYFGFGTACGIEMDRIKVEKTAGFMTNAMALLPAPIASERWSVSRRDLRTVRVCFSTQHNGWLKHNHVNASVNFLKWYVLLTGLLIAARV